MTPAYIYVTLVTYFFYLGLAIIYRKVAFFPGLQMFYYYYNY